MLVLLHERQTGCRFFRQVGIECGLAPDLPTVDVLKYLVGENSEYVDEPSTLLRLQTMAEHVLVDARLVSDVTIPVALSIQHALHPTPEYCRVDLTVWENIRKHAVRRHAIYIQDPLLYELVVSLQQGQSMKNVLDTFPEHRTPPSLLGLWATWAPLTSDPSATFLSRSHSFALLRERIQQDPCYPYLRQVLHRELDHIRINLLNELYLSYTTLSSSDLHDILVHLELSLGLQSLVEDCTRPQVSTGISSSDVLVLCLCLLLVGGISWGLVHRYQNK